MYGAKIGIPELIVLLLIFIVVVVAWAKIFSKSGHSPAFCILMCIPLVNVITFFWFAFSTWPVERRLRHGEPQL